MEVGEADALELSFENVSIAIDRGTCVAGCKRLATALGLASSRPPPENKLELVVEHKSPHSQAPTVSLPGVKRVLCNTTGVFPPGSLVAIMGSSGMLSGYGCHEFSLSLSLLQPAEGCVAYSLSLSFSLFCNPLRVAWHPLTLSPSLLQPAEGCVSLSCVY